MHGESGHGMAGQGQRVHDVKVVARIATTPVMETVGHEYAHV